VEALCRLGKSEDAVVLLSHYGSCFNSLTNDSISKNESSNSKEDNDSSVSNVFIEKTELLLL
jgi:hypothetical protein